MSLRIDELRLAPIMKQRATELADAFPDLIRWTSGRRTIHEQAHAMAVNHTLDPKGYMMRSYVHAGDFLGALSARPWATSIDEITEVFYDVMTEHPGMLLSPHLDGNAVDLQPMEYADGMPTTDGQRVIDWIKACPDTVNFRTREGHLKRWHWQTVSVHSLFQQSLKEVV